MNNILETVEKQIGEMIITAAICTATKKGVDLIAEKVITGNKNRKLKKQHKKELKELKETNERLKRLCDIEYIVSKKVDREENDNEITYLRKENESLRRVLAKVWA